MTGTVAGKDSVNSILQVAVREGLAVESQHATQETTKNGHLVSRIDPFRDAVGMTGSGSALLEGLRRFWKEPAPEADEGAAKPTQIPAEQVEPAQKASQGT